MCQKLSEVPLDGALLIALHDVFEPPSGGCGHQLADVNVVPPPFDESVANLVHAAESHEVMLTGVPKPLFGMLGDHHVALRQHGAGMQDVVLEWIQAEAQTRRHLNRTNRTGIAAHQRDIVVDAGRAKQRANAIEIALPETLPELLNDCFVGDLVARFAHGCESAHGSTITLTDPRPFTLPPPA